MNDAMEERYGALGVVWFVVLAVIGLVLAGSEPSRTDSAAEIAKYYADNDTGLQVGAFLAGLAIVGLVVWFGSVWRAMVRAEGGTSRLALIAAIGVVISTITAIGSIAIDAGTAAAIDQLGEGSAVFFQLSSVLFGFSPIGDVLFVGAISVLAHRTGFLPKWTAQAGLVVVAVALVASLSIASDAAFFEVFAIIAGVTWMLWILSVGILLYKQAPSSA